MSLGVPNFRPTFADKFGQGTWHDGTLLTELPAIGDYLEGRLRRALGLAVPLTVGDVLRAFRGKRTERVVHILKRALQNRRCNQCDLNTQYHTGDVNSHGYESLATLLEHARRAGRQGLTSQPPLPRPPKRSQASKRCGCLFEGECFGPCVWSDGACFARDVRTKGFWSADPHPGQVVVAPTEADARAVKSRARTRHYERDPDSAADVRALHPKSMRYSRRGRKLWRHSGSKTRLPIVRV